MNLYTLALFTHVVGVIGIFAGLSTWLFGIAVLRRTERVEQVRLVVGLILASGNLVVGSILVLAAAGIYMAVTVWADERPAWILVATASFLLLAPLGVLILDRRVRAIAKQVRSMPDGVLPAPLAAATHNPVLAAGLRLDIAVLLGIVFLMTTKPHLAESLLAAGMAFILGVASCVPLWSSQRSKPLDRLIPKSKRK